MAVCKAAFLSSAAERAGWENALEEHLTEAGFVVTSREVSRDGPWRIEIFGEEQDPRVAAALAKSARSLCRPVPDWTWETLPDIDWVAENQRSFQPFAVGPFWVHPSHITEGQPAGTIALLIDAGLAFGTGTHATTRGCLELLATLDASETVNAVDVGCGSGIAMARLWRRAVIGGDNDAEAVAVARENAGLNGVGALCRFVTSAGLQAPELAARAPYDLIVANILAGPLVDLSESFAASVRPGGRVLLSGLLVEQAADVVAAYCRHGLVLEHRVDFETGGDQWRSLILRKC
jgi:ribosomal protein L11 methyltransferase